MSEWKKVKIGDFLEQYRNTIYIDDSVEYGQITISSKDGVKYRCSKMGKEIGRKRQFVIDLKTHPNTVIFTRQGIADGSIGIAPLVVGFFFLFSIVLIFMGLIGEYVLALNTRIINRPLVVEEKRINFNSRE